MTEGFYKLNESGEWLFAPNAVFAPTYTLTKENKQSIDGWQWQDEAPEAYIIWINQTQESNG